jgi:hypothetical protein
MKSDIKLSLWFEHHIFNKYLRCSVIGVNATLGEDEAGVEDGGDDIMLIGIVTLDKAFVLRGTSS